MKVGDLIQLEMNGGPWSTGLVCEIEEMEEQPESRGRPGRQHKYWTVWEDGEYSWITEKDYVEIINESR
jgi:hypothetical protein